MCPLTRRERKVSVIDLPDPSQFWITYCFVTIAEIPSRGLFCFLGFFVYMR